MINEIKDLLRIEKVLIKKVNDNYFYMLVIDKHLDGVKFSISHGVVATLTPWGIRGGFVGEARILEKIIEKYDLNEEVNYE